MTLRIGTRGSALARAQTQMIADQLAVGGDVELVIIRTTGDETAGPLLPSMGTGLFTRQLETALLDGRVDVAVHSLKDLPTVGDPRLVVAAMPPREDPRDALVSPLGASLSSLPEGTTVGTSSLRRQSALRRRFPGLAPRPLRGNVDTRLAKLAAGEYGAILLARAGMRRLGRDEGTPVPAEELLPAPAQGTLGIQCRTDDAATRARVAALDCAATRAACVAERALLRRLEGGCQLPIGALGVVSGDTLTLRAALWAPDGSAEVTGQRSGAVGDPAALGEALADEMLADGGAAILAACRAAEG